MVGVSSSSSAVSKLLDESELLDGLHARELLVDALDLAPDEVWTSFAGTATQNS